MAQVQLNILLKVNSHGNGHKENTLKFERGTLGLARQDYTIYYYYTGDASYLTKGYNSGCTQFFITAEDCSDKFDGYYCAFGKVIEGMEVADEIVNAKRDWDDKPYEDQTIKSMTVETFGEEYKEPVIIE